MIILSCIAIAAKKTFIAAPYMIAAGVSLPLLFAQGATFLGPHALAGIGAVIGCAIRFQMLKVAWRKWPAEAVCASLLGLLFGQAELPVISALLQKTSPEMYPLSQGAAIGILMAAGTGFLSDVITTYRKKIASGAP